MSSWVARQFANLASRLNFLAPSASIPAPLYRQVATYRLFDWLAGIPDPDEVLLRTGRTRANLRELLRDSEVSQALDTRREAVIATPWRFEPGTSREEKFIAEQLSPHIESIVTALWAAVPYGYAVIEPVYKRLGGASIGIGNVFAPPFEWFRPMPDGTLRYFPEDGSGGLTGLDLGPRKFIVAQRNADYRNPYGESMLSSLYWPVTWRLQGWQLWLDFLDTFGAPIVIGRTSSYQAFVDAMIRQGVKRAVGWQPVGDNEAITTITASVPGEFEKLENALNRTIQKVVLGQTLTSEVTGTGSYAAAKVHDEVREDKRRADVRIIMLAVNKLVAALWGLNGFAGAPSKFIMQDDVGLETERASRDKTLSEIGVEFTAEYFADRYDLEPTDFKIAPKPQAPIMSRSPNAPSGNLASLAAGGERFTPTQMVIERGIADLMRLDPRPLSLRDLRSVVVGARTEDELRQRLAVLYSDARDPDFDELVARCIFAAQVLGYIHAAEHSTPAKPIPEGG